jgi:hypothetical protein
LQKKLSLEALKGVAQCFDHVCLYPLGVPIASSFSLLQGCENKLEVFKFGVVKQPEDLRFELNESNYSFYKMFLFPLFENMGELLE